MMSPLRFRPEILTSRTSHRRSLIRHQYCRLSLVSFTIKLSILLSYLSIMPSPTAGEIFSMTVATAVMYNDAEQQVINYLLI
jgi:hypothetical protein